MPDTVPILFGRFNGSYDWAPQAPLGLNGTIAKPREVLSKTNASGRQGAFKPHTSYTYSAIAAHGGTIVTDEKITEQTDPISDSVKSALLTWGLTTPRITKGNAVLTWGSFYNVTADVSPGNKALGSLFGDLNSMIRFHSNSGDTTQRPPFDSSSPVWNSFEDGRKLWGDPAYPAANGSFRGVFSDNSADIKKLMVKQAEATRLTSTSGSPAVPCNFVPGQSIFQSPINALHSAMAYAEQHTFGNGATFCLLRVNADGEPKVIGTNITTVENPPPRPGIVEFGMAIIDDMPAWRPILRENTYTETHLIDTDDFTRWGSSIITEHVGRNGENGADMNMRPGTAQLHTDLSGGGYIIVLVPGPGMDRDAILYELYKAYDMYNPKTRPQFEQLLKVYYDFNKMSETYEDFTQIGTTLTGIDNQTLHTIRTELFKFVSEFSEDSLRSTYVGNLTMQADPLKDRNWVAAAKFTLTDRSESDILGVIEARNACEDIMQQLKHLPLITELIQNVSSGHTYGFYIEYGNADAPEIIFKKVNNDSWWFGLGNRTGDTDPLTVPVNHPLKTYEVLSNGTLQEIVQRVIPADEAGPGAIAALWKPLAGIIDSTEFNDDVKLVLMGSGTMSMVYYAYTHT